MGSHGAVASYALGDAVTQAALHDWRTAPVSPQLRTTLGLLEKLTLTPEDVSPQDVEAVREVGVSEGAIVDAIYICAAFNLIDRVADALGFEIPESFARGAASQLKRGYKL
jgi:alkylhydroperoxidase family enzyme